MEIPKGQRLSMDEKKQKKYLNKCLRVLKGKNSYKIRTFTDLAKAIKTSVKTFRFYNLNNIPEIKEILQKNRHENKPVKVKKKIKPKLPQKNVEEEKKVLLKSVKDSRVRSYQEIRAKLFGYQAFKKKNYAKLSESAKRLLDRQIWILKWVLLQEDKKEETGGNNGCESNPGE